MRLPTKYRVPLIPPTPWHLLMGFGVAIMIALIWNLDVIFIYTSTVPKTMKHCFKYLVAICTS